jgi:hypothetical protein
MVSEIENADLKLPKESSYSQVSIVYSKNRKPWGSGFNWSNTCHKLQEGRP